MNCIKSLVSAVFVVLAVVQSAAQLNHVPPASAFEEALLVELTMEEAIRTAKKHLRKYSNVCVLRGEGGVSLENEFYDVFDLNARIVDDLTGGENLVTPEDYVRIFNKHFADQILRADFELNEELITAEFVPAGEFVEVVIPYQKTLSQHYEAGRPMGELKQFQKAYIRVFKDRSKPVKISKIEEFVPNVKSEFSLGITVPYVFYSGRFSELEAFGGMDNTFDMAGGLRIRFIGNPLKPTNFTQRKGIRFIVGVDVTYHYGRYTNDNWSHVSPGDTVLVAPESASMNANDFEGVVLTEESSYEATSSQVFVSPILGINFTKEISGRKRVFLNLGVGYDLMVYGKYKDAATCSYTLDMEAFASSQENDITAEPWDPSAVTDETQVYGDYCLGEDERETDYKENNNGAFLFVNPTYQMAFGNERWFELGVDARLSLSPRKYRGASFDGDRAARTDQALTELYSGEVSFFSLGVSAAIIF